jgi:hypothetical protein
MAPIGVDGNRKNAYFADVIRHLKTRSLPWSSVGMGVRETKKRNYKRKKM